MMAWSGLLRSIGLGVDGNFDSGEDEELCQIQHDEAKEHFEEYGFVQCHCVFG